MNKMSLLNFSAVAIAFSLTAICFANEPQVKAGNVVIKPSFELKIEENSNLFEVAENETNTLHTRYRPGLLLELEKRSVDVSIEYLNSTGVFEDSSDDNYVDHHLFFDMALQLSRRNKLLVDANYIESHDDRVVDEEGFSSIDEPNEYSQSEFGLRYFFGRDKAKGQILFFADYFDREYQNNRAFTQQKDRKGMELGGAFYLRMTPNIDFLVEYSREDLDYTNDPTEVAMGLDTLDSYQDNYLTGAKWNFSKRTFGELKVGYVAKKFDDTDREDFSGLSWEVSLDWGLNKRSLVSIVSTREAKEANNGASGGYIDASSFDVSWGYDWTRKLRTELSASYQEDEYIDVLDDRDDELTSYLLSVSYQLNRWIDLGLSAGYTERNSSIDEFNYERELYSLSISYGY